MNRKIVWLSLALLVLLGVGVYFWMYGKPTTPKVNPLKNIEAKNFSQLILKKQYRAAIRFQKETDGWLMLEPEKDIVDPAVLETLTTSLKNFALGSVISENPARYTEFHVDPANATQIDLYVQGQEKPVLSGFVGKDSGQYQSCYFRFNVSSGPVYIANGLPASEFDRMPNGFRETRVWSLPADELDRIQFVDGKKTWTLSRSSHTWALSTGKAVDPDVMTALIAKIRDIKAVDFATDLGNLSKFGFEKPSQGLTVASGGNNYSFTVGQAVELPKLPMPQTPIYYARSSSRTAIFVIADSTRKDLQDSFLHLSK